MPKTALGKWSVGLNAFFLVAVATSCVLVLLLKVLSFDNHWADVTAAVAFPASIIALITGVIAVKKFEERSALVYLSILVGIATVLFILLHSLFIND
ncbi:MAG TPA: hypothetical protein VMQ44_01300 [Candidatus Saccharimonadales bacterium]|nr:hypothetical protein [Candidatus Saccharimonadales bacterium]